MAAIIIMTDIRTLLEATVDTVRRMTDHSVILMVTIMAPRRRTSTTTTVISMATMIPEETKDMVRRIQDRMAMATITSQATIIQKEEETKLSMMASKRSSNFFMTRMASSMTSSKCRSYLMATEDVNL
jgi:hypothetical protein